MRYTNPRLLYFTLLADRWYFNLLISWTISGSKVWQYVGKQKLWTSTPCPPTSKFWRSRSSVQTFIRGENGHLLFIHSSPLQYIACGSMIHPSCKQHGAHFVLSPSLAVNSRHAGLEDIMIFSKISKYRKYQKYHDIFDIFDIFQKMKIFE